MRDELDELLDQSAFAAATPGEPFLRAAATCLDVLCERFPRYAEFIAHRAGRDIRGPFASLDELDQLPALFLPVLKYYQSAPPPGVVIEKTLTSSGTTGRPSVTPLDEPSWRRRVRAMRATYQALGLLEGKMSALAFLMDPATTQMAGSLVIDAVLRSVPGVAGVRYLARLGPAGPQFAGPEATELLVRAAGEGPVVLVGYPALIAATVQGLIHAGQTSLPLQAGSRVLTGGG